MSILRNSKRESETIWRNGDEFRELAKTVGKSAEEIVNNFLTSGSAAEQGYKDCVSLRKLANRYGTIKLESLYERMLSCLHLRRPSVQSLHF